MRLHSGDRKRSIDWMTIIIMIIGLALALNAVIAW
jgi:hypothetical protein